MPAKGFDLRPSNQYILVRVIPGCFQGNKYRNLLPEPPGWRSLKNRGNKLRSWVLWYSDLRKAVLAMSRKNWKLQTRLLVSDGAPHQKTRNCLKIIKGRRGKIGRGSQMGAWLWLWLVVSVLRKCVCVRYVYCEGVAQDIWQLLVGSCTLFIWTGGHVSLRVVNATWIALE
jgi:hypothetical protein